MLRAHARPKTTRSRSEFAPRRLAPCTEAQAASPQAYRPGTTWSWPFTCLRTWGRRPRLASTVCLAPFLLSRGREWRRGKTGHPLPHPRDTTHPPPRPPVLKSKDGNLMPRRPSPHLTCPRSPTPAVGAAQGGQQAGEHSTGRWRAGGVSAAHLTGRGAQTLTKRLSVVKSSQITVESMHSCRKNCKRSNIGLRKN